MIKFTTINVDGIEITRELTFKEFEADWFSEDCSLPMCDDAVVFAEIDGEKIEAKIFEDVVAHIIAIYY